MNTFLSLKDSLTESDIAVIFARASDHFPPRVKLAKRKTKKHKKETDIIDSPRFDGYGGHFNAKKGDRSIYDTAKRKLLGKANVIAKTKDLVLVGVIDVFYSGNKTKVHDRRIHYFFLYRYEGSLQETEKMWKPRLFSAHDAPYEHMRPVDQVILPLILEEKYVKGVVRLTKDQKGKVKIADKSLTQAPVIRCPEKTDKLPRDLM